MQKIYTYKKFHPTSLPLDIHILLVILVYYEIIFSVTPSQAKGVNRMICKSNILSSLPLLVHSHFSFFSPSFTLATNMLNKVYRHYTLIDLRPYHMTPMFFSSHPTHFIYIQGMVWYVCTG